MLRPKNKPSILLAYLSILFFLNLLLIFTNCSQRPEEDAVVNAKEDFESKHGNKISSEQFEAAIQVIGESNNADQLVHAFNVASRIINQEINLLNTDAGSEKNVLYIVLDLIGKITGEEGVIVAEGYRADKLIQIFKLLVKNKVPLNEDLLTKKHEAVANGQQSLYYPFAVLGAIGPVTPVGYKHDRINGTIQLISWVIVKDNFNKKLKKELLDMWINQTANTDVAKSMNTLDNTQYGKLTPAMLIARQARSNSSDEEAKDNLDMFKILLGYSGIKLMDMKNLSAEVKEPAKLNKQPLLGFIIYNCVSTEVRFNNEWFEILEKALNAGDLAKNPNKKKKAIQDYINDYIENQDSDKNLDFNYANGLYNTTMVQKVKQILQDYVDGKPTK